MGLFNRKPDNRVKCPECSGSGISGFHEIKNPQPRPQVPGFRTYGSSDGSISDYSSYYNYEEKITVSDKCTTCNGKGKVDPEVASAHRAPTDYKEFKGIIPKRISEKVNPADPKSDSHHSSVPTPAPREIIRGSKVSASQLQMDGLIEKCNASFQSLKGLSKSSSPYQDLDLLLDKSFSELSKINGAITCNLADCNSACLKFLIELDLARRGSDQDSKGKLDDLQKNFSEFIYLKSKELGLRYTFREINGVKIVAIEHWS